MIENDNNRSFAHKGVKLFWTSGGVNHSKIQASFAPALADVLHHLSIARSLADIFSEFGAQKNVKRLKGQTDRYSMEVNGNFRLTFTCAVPGNGVVTKIDLEDYHSSSGPKKR